MHSFLSNAQLKITLIVAHARMEMNSEHILVVLNFCPNREWLVPEVPEAACKLLCGAIVLVIIWLKAIINHCHYVRVVVFVVIIKWVKKHSQTVPLVRTTKNLKL